MLQDIEPEVILFLSTLQEIRIKTDTGDNLAILKDNSAHPEIGIIVKGKKQGPLSLILKIFWYVPVVLTNL